MASVPRQPQHHSLRAAAGCPAHRTQADLLRNGVFSVITKWVGDRLYGPSETGRSTQRSRSEITAGGHRTISQPSAEGFNPGLTAAVASTDL